MLINCCCFLFQG